MQVQEKGQGGLSYNPTVPEHQASVPTQCHCDYYNSDSPLDRDKPQTRNQSDVDMEDDSPARPPSREHSALVEQIPEPVAFTCSPSWQDSSCDHYNDLPEVQYHSSAFSSLMMDRQPCPSQEPIHSRTDSWRPGNPFDRSPPQSSASQRSPSKLRKSSCFDLC